MKTMTLRIDNRIKEKFLWLLEHFSEHEIKILEQSQSVSDDEYVRTIDEMVPSITDSRNEPKKPGIVLNERYSVMLHHTEEGISVSVPGLPGCWSEGETEEEALDNIRDAIQEYWAAVRQQAQPADTKLVEVTV